MLGPGDQVFHPVLAELGRKPARPPPVVVLWTSVAQHLFRGRVFPDRHPVGFDHALRRRAPVELQVDDVARVVIQERHRIGVLAAQFERKDVRLPHLVRRRPLKVARAHQVAAGLRPLVHEVRRVERLPDRLRARLEEKPPTQAVGDPLHPKEGVSSLHLHDLLPHRPRESPRPGRRLPPQPHLAILAVPGQPPSQRARAHPRFLAHQHRVEALLKVQLHRPQLLLVRVALAAGAGSAPAIYGLLYLFLVFHGNTPSFIGVLPNFPVIVCLRSGS